MKENGDMHNEVEIVLGESSLKSVMNQARELPFKLSKSLSFENNSPTIKSQAVDSLLNQNEDLMARMRVASKRFGELEDQLDKQTQLIESLKHERSNLKEQILILNEKEFIYRSRTEGAVNQNSDLKAENTALLKRLQKVERAFRRLFKYREKIRAAMPDLKIFKSKALRAHELNEHLKIQVSELSNRLQRIHSETSEAQTKLVEDYEMRLSTLQAEHNEVKERAQDRDEVHLEKIHVENRLVEIERQLFNTKSMYSQENSSLKTDVEHFRKQTKELLLDCETLKGQVTERAKENEELKEQNTKLIDQVESLQMLWKEKQIELERNLEKQRALQKLNQDISIKLNEAKKEIFDLKTKVELKTIPQ